MNIWDFIIAFITGVACTLSTIVSIVLIKRGIAIGKETARIRKMKIEAAQRLESQKKPCPECGNMWLPETNYWKCKDCRDKYYADLKKNK